MTASPLDTLLQHPGLWRGSNRRHSPLPGTAQGLSTGFASLDQELPAGGWPSQSLMEVLVDQWGTGELPLLQPALARLSQQARWLVWVAPPWLPYAPGLHHAGIHLERLLVVQPRNAKDALWAMQECLQSGCCSAVLGWPSNPTVTSIRRLQRAAQQGASWGVLLRPASHAQQPSPAPLRVMIAPASHRLQVRIIKCPGRWGSDWLTCAPASTTAQPPALLTATTTATPSPTPRGPLHAVDLPVFSATAARPLSRQPNRPGLGD